MNVLYLGGRLSMLKQMSAQYIVTFVPKGTIVEHRQSIQDMLVEYFPAESYQVFDYTIKTGFPVEIPTDGYLAFWAFQSPDWRNRAAAHNRLRSSLLFQP